MQLYSFGWAKTTTGAAGPVVTFVAPATARPDVREIGIFATTAVASTIGLGRTGTNGTGAITGSPLSAAVALDTSDPAATCQVATSFGTSQPAAPTAFLNMIALPAVVGSGMVWTWGPNEFPVVSGAQLVLWQNTTAAVGFTGYIRWEE